METKWCFWCDKRKDVNEFNMDRWSEDGYSAKCKLCVKEYSKKYRVLNRERLREYAKSSKYRKTERGRATRQKAVERYRKKNPLKFKVYSAVSYEIKNGRMERGECEFCDTNNKTHGHHEEYNKPLDVIWLCPACHKKWHRALKFSKT